MNEPTVEPTTAPQVIQVQWVPPTRTPAEQAVIDQAFQQIITSANHTTGALKFLLWMLGFLGVSWLFFILALFSNH